MKNSADIENTEDVCSETKKEYHILYAHYTLYLRHKTTFATHGDTKRAIQTLHVKLLKCCGAGVLLMSK